MTLTEILIAMLVMALGLLGLFALFPLGLLNVTSAVTHNRSEALGRSALADLRVHNLLAPERYYFGQTPVVPTTPAPPFTPFVYDDVTGSLLNPPPPGFPFKPFPVAIDPISIGQLIDDRIAAGVAPQLARTPPFPRLGLMDQINNATGLFPGGDGADPNGIGLQRVTPTDGLDNDFDGFVDASDNLPPGGDGVPDTWPDITLPATFAERFLSRAQTDQVFAGRDDMVFREDDPSLPMVDASGSLVSERNFSYLVTARLADVSDPRTYEIAIVTFFKRDLTNELALPAAYLPDLVADPMGQTPSNRVVLRWSALAAEPELRREGWFLDATYNLPVNPGPHRGYWYHYVQVGEPKVVDMNGDGDVADAVDEVRVTLTLDRPAREVTFPVTFNETGLQLVDGLDNNNNGLVDLEDFVVDPLQTSVNVAVFIPGVVSVYEKTVRAE